MKFSKGEIICREDLGYPEGALVCDGYEEGGRLLAHPLGGGFQLTVPAQDERRFRVVAEGERTAALFHKGRFTVADGESAFDGWSNGELWNGWAMPRFGFAVCQEVLKRLGKESAHLIRPDGHLLPSAEKEGYDATRDAFITMSQDGEEEVWAGEQITISDGSRIKVYPLGAGAWTWECEPHGPTGELPQEGAEIAKKKEQQ